MKRDILLVVDDSALDLAVLREIFRPLFQVECVEDANAALSYAQRQASRICAVLLDICLGRRGAGLLLLQRLQADPAAGQLPVILITADAREEYVVSGVNKGATDFLVKPVDPVIAQERVCAAVRAAWPVGSTVLDGEITGKQTATTQQKKAEPAVENQWEELLEQFVRSRQELSMEEFRSLGRVTGALAAALCKSDPGRLRWEEARQISRAAVFCDVGMLGIPDEIIAQGESQSGYDLNIYWRHTELGQMLFATRSPQDHPEVGFAAEIACWHHKNYDGSGYPEGPGGDAIPLSAQLVRTALRFMEYARRFWGYPDWLDRALRALGSDAGCVISQQMYQIALAAREDLAGCLNGKNGSWNR